MTPHLTRRQREVVVAILLGSTNKEAAIRLGMSPRSIEGHLIKIWKKYEVSSTKDLLLKLWRTA